MEEGEVSNPMILLISLRLKELFSYLLPMCMILAASLVFGTISSIALAERSPVFKIALYNEDGGELAGQLAEFLIETPGLEVQPITGRTDGNELLAAGGIEALVVIYYGFETAIADTSLIVAGVYPAPASIVTEAISETVSLNILRLRALNILITELEALEEGLSQSAAAVHARYAVENPVVLAAYTGPDVFIMELPVPPMHGVQALFILLSGLHAATILPGVSARLSRKAMLKNHIAGLIAVLICWTLQLIVYLIVISTIFGSFTTFYNFMSLFALIVISVALGALASVAKLRRDVVIFMFIPYFLLNMTIGGALWGRLVGFPMIEVLIPVAGALSGAGGNIDAVISALIIGTVLHLAAASLLVMSSKSKAG